VRALEALARGRFATRSAQAWLYRLAHNQVVDHYRRRGTALPLEDGAPALDDVPETVLQRQQRAQLRQALAHLTQDQQEILRLRFGEGLKAGAIAEVLGKSEGAIRALQHRALATLRRLIHADAE
jgi:RNA polymerase sigma-70 factor (ECF subfamily)